MTAMSPDEAVFFAALARVDPAERAAYLDEACGADADLRRRVERLLAAHPRVGSFLRDDAAVAPSPPAESGPTWAAAPPSNSPTAERPGTVIGPYKLLQQIGEGGMGTVYLAEQESPIRRTVALKVIKPGMDTRQVVARFEAERQALAMMDHVNIARVLDAGATDEGRPYFVMELVKGVPITEFCDQVRLPIPGAAGALHDGLPGGAARPSEGDHPSGSQAVERPGDAPRRRAGPQGHRLRRGQGDRAGSSRRRRSSPASRSWSARRCT